MGITSLDVENKIFTYPRKLINILDFDFKKLSIQKVGDDITCIYYIYYNKDPFYLFIDNLKGYFKKNDNNKYLTIIFMSESQKMMYEKYGKKLKKLLIIKLAIITKIILYLNLILMTFCL